MFAIILLVLFTCRGKKEEYRLSFFILERIKMAVFNESSVQQGTSTKETEKTSFIPEEKKSSSLFLTAVPVYSRKLAVKINRNIFLKEF